MTDATTPAPQHSFAEDVVAIVVGTLFVSFGLAMFKQAGLLTGGTSGLSFLVYYLTKVPFGLLFFLFNLPFYYLAYTRLGKRFTVKTFCAVALTAAMSEVHARFIHFSLVDPFYTAVFGGLLMGVGFIILFRHQASLGGVNVLALHIQEKFGVRAGKVQLAIDLAILLASVFVVDTRALVASVIGTVCLNSVIWINHRRDRYVASSAP